MASSIAAKPNSRLRHVLSTLEPRARLPSPLDIYDVEKAAQRRQDDYDAVQKALEDLTDLGEEDKWICDFLDVDGSSKEELATILVDEKYDSPWIFRPDDFEAVSWEELTSSSSASIPLPKLDSSTHSEPLQNETDGLGVSMPTLSSRQGWNREGERGSIIGKDDFDSTSSMTAFKGSTLGIAGYLPVEFKRFPTHETQHEAWLEEWHRNVVAFSRDSYYVSVSYTSRAPLDLDWMKSLADRTLLAMRKLLEHLAALKKEKPSFNQLLFPALHSSSDAVHISRIKFSVIEEFSACLLKYVTSLFELCSEHATHVDYHFTGTELDSMLLLFAQDFQLHELIEHRKSLVSIMRQMIQSFMHSVPLRRDLENLLEPFHHNQSEELPLDLKLEQNILHLAALIAQTLCLALQSYSQAHIGKLKLSCLDRSITRVHLHGAGQNWMNSTKSFSGSITVSLQPLTCFGKMARGPLLVFHHSEWKLDRGTSCDLIATPKDLATIWGPTSHLCDTSSKKLNILAIYIGGGVLLPSSSMQNGTSSPTLWHWTREADSSLPEGKSWFNIKSKAYPINQLSTPIRIGSLFNNPNCPLSRPKEQEQLRNLAQDQLHAIAAFDPHWELTTVQTGAQAFQWVVPQFTAGWTKIPGQTRKQDIVTPGSSSFISELSNASGVLLCLCTGIAQRVPLRVVVAKCMDPHMNDLFPSMAEWSTLRDSHQMIKEFENPETDLIVWQKNLPKELHEPAGTIVKMILNRIQHTGVDHDNALNVAWPRADRGFDSLKIPCKKENTWARILADSLDNATFACITPACLSLRTNHPNPRHRCLGTVPTAWDAIRPYCLVTQVRLTRSNKQSASASSSDGLGVREGSTYWIGPDELMLVATCIAQTEELILQVKNIPVPIRIFKRFIKKSTIKETNDGDARDCLLVTRKV